MNENTVFVKLKNENYLYDIANEVFIEIKQGYTIGRDKADLVLKTDKLLSKSHCEIEIKANIAFLHDLNSTNGSMINGQRISSQQLKHNDIISLGKTNFIYSKSNSLADIIINTKFEVTADEKAKNLIKMYFIKPFKIKTWSKASIIFSILALLTVFFYQLLFYFAMPTTTLYSSMSFYVQLILQCSISLYISLVFYFWIIEAHLKLFIKNKIGRLFLDVAYIFIFCIFILMSTVLPTLFNSKSFSALAINNITEACHQNFNLYKCSKRMPILLSVKESLGTELTNKILQNFNAKLALFIESKNSTLNENEILKLKQKQQEFNHAFQSNDESQYIKKTYAIRNMFKIVAVRLTNKPRSIN